jgi:hypothetical protein
VSEIASVLKQEARSKREKRKAGTKRAETKEEQGGNEKAGMNVLLGIKKDGSRRGNRGRARINKGTQGGGNGGRTRRAEMKKHSETNLMVKIHIEIICRVNVNKR